MSSPAEEADEALGRVASEHLILLDGSFCLKNPQEADLRRIVYDVKVED